MHADAAADAAAARAGALSHVSAHLVVHIDAIARIAAETEPSWTVVNPEVDVHSWCGDACARVGNLLAAHGLHVRLVRGELRGWTHVWLVLTDGSILDPTISQFDRPGTEYVVDTDTEVHWLRSPAGAHIALIATSEPLHRDYRAQSRQ